MMVTDVGHLCQAVTNIHFIVVHQDLCIEWFGSVQSRAHQEPGWPPVRIASQYEGPSLRRRKEIYLDEKRLVDVYIYIYTHIHIKTYVDIQVHKYNRDKCRYVEM